MIPTSLDGWTIDVVRELLARGYDEGDRFDFKEMLPQRGDQKGRLRLAKSCCAFANSQGGFIVFGVVNAKVRLDERLSGIDPAIDFPVQFGPYPSRCVPSVDWTPRNPPLTLSSGRLVTIIHVPPSLRAPHAVEDDSGGWYFAKRTSKGNEAMTIEEVRGAFLGLYEKRVKLQLLYAELERMRYKSGRMVLTGSDLNDKTTMLTFDVAVLESVLADTYTLLARSPLLLSKLGEIRDRCREVNDAVDRMKPVFYQSMTNWQSINSDHNLIINTAALNVARLVDEALPLLDELRE